MSLGFRIASFALGTAVIVDALVSSARVVQWVVGLILVGVVPPDVALSSLRRRRPDDEADG